ncbi:MAG: hypothetical protein H7Y07_06850 [Pyrinomonadaceae bacterium]|nr:hypothetical protein [Sphingobacteriaceae bacterium]
MTEFYITIAVPAASRKLRLRYCFEMEWIKRSSAKLGRKGDPKMLEKVIHALTLREQLKVHGLD